MIQEFVRRFDANRDELARTFALKHVDSYEEIVKRVVVAISGEDGPDPERVHVIDDGGYSGVLVFIISGSGYAPRDFWYVKVWYGSCPGCDLLQSIRGYTDDPPTPSQVADYMTLALHVIQCMKKMEDAVDA